MRLSEQQVLDIRELARELFHADARLWLFGSPLDDKPLTGGGVPQP